jgi:putative endonuclease
MKDRQYCVYIMTNAHNTVLYTGVTNCLQRRVLEHKSGKGGVFTKRYNITKFSKSQVCCSNGFSRWDLVNLRKKATKVATTKHSNFESVIYRNWYIMNMMMM